ncbi:MAG TPA: PIN domain-containing protein [Aromatoleum sp.]|uniref:PIN-like domain-containing protein n=1 Tax=Aromatoleum sp. TaxID=2307007 RepID=UPI002B497524|nr:PIN domain-containing protein [Aromatoleum sp.]HJV26725.1 PIN domain-containing protein [Aromatoleum sp.]
MRTMFPGHFPPIGAEVEGLWADCVFVLDANILLNLYRYSDATRDEFVEILEALKDRLWLPHRAAEEYFDNRLTVIAQQEKAYEDALKTIKGLEESLSNAREHPFLSDGLMRKFSGVLQEVVAELGETKKNHAGRMSQDGVHKTVAELFDGRVGSPYPNVELEEICKDGEDRYARKVPPGYKDEGKGGAVDAYRKFGDLIVWRQIMDRASEVKKPVIFISDDKKEDWWQIFRGKTLGPRPELIAEFTATTEQQFYMYPADRFLEYAAKIVKRDVTPESVNEVRDLRKRDLVFQQANLPLAPSHVEEESVRSHFLIAELANKAHTARKRLHEAKQRLPSLRMKADSLRFALSLHQENLERSKGNDEEAIAGIRGVTEEEREVEREFAALRQLETECFALEKALEAARDTQGDHVLRPAWAGLFDSDLPSNVRLVDPTRVLNR